jgi:hypothetical protein
VTLAEFLAQAARTPFRLGAFDCKLWLADWIALNRGVDPAAHLRGAYDSPIGYMRLVRKAGGSVPLVASCVEPIGMVRVRTPKAGDIGVVRAVTTDGFGEVGAIRTVLGWASLSPSGLLTGETDHLAAWRV